MQPGAVHGGLYFPGRSPRSLVIAVTELTSASRRPDAVTFNIDFPSANLVMASSDSA